MQDWPDLLNFLKDKFDYQIKFRDVSLGYKVFEIDLSQWKLRLSHQTPLIWACTSNLNDTEPRHVYERIQDVIRERGISTQIVLVLVDSDIDSLKKYVSPLENIVLIGVREKNNVMCSNRPSGVLLDIIFEQLQLSMLSPYEITAPVTGSRFFGRDHEVKRLINNADTNHLILGIRRIGKTSLLMETERILSQKRDGPHVIYMDCSDLTTTDDFIRETVRKLEPRELPRLDMQKYVFYFPNFLDRMKKKYRKIIVFLLDEIDRLVAAQRGDWEIFRMLRTASTKGSCRYIIAGFREAQLDAYHIDSPFYNFASPYYLNEFTHEQAKELILTPMRSLRIHISNEDEVVNRILEETAGYPNLIQYYCMILVRQLDQTGEREIGVNSLINVYADEGFKRHLLTSFINNTHNHEKGIVYAILCNTDENWRRGFTLAHIDACLRRQNVILSLKDIDSACNVLKTAGFLQQKGRDFFFSSPVFVKVLLDSSDPEFLLRKVKEEGI